MTMQVEVKILDKEFWSGRDLPTYATSGSIAMDLVAAIPETIYLNPGEQVMVPTGLAISIGDDDVGFFINPRSGLGSKGLVLGNLEGLVDSDYQGEIKICLWNRSKHAQHTINPGDRIVQGYFGPVIKASLKLVDEFSEKTERGEGGWGSTGK